MVRANVRRRGKEQVLGREGGGKSSKWKFCPGVGKFLDLFAPQFSSEKWDSNHAYFIDCRLNEC